MGSVKTLKGLKPGAILFKYKSDGTGKAIAFGQTLREFSDNKAKHELKQKIVQSSTDVSHALIYIGNARVVEAIGSGVQVSTLLGGHNLLNHFEVYNPTNDALAAEAVKIARAAAYGRGGYSYSGLVNAGMASVISLLTKLTMPVATALGRINVGDVFKPSQKAYKENLEKFTAKIKKGEPVTFFCSELVAFCYDAAALALKQPLIATDFSHHSSPKDLLADVGASTNFTYMGDLEPTDINKADVPKNDTLWEMDCLAPDGSITSPNGKYVLIYQTWGNLALYNTDLKKAVWASHTEKKGTLATILHEDGNLVIWDNVPVMNKPKLTWNPLKVVESMQGTSNAIWQTNTRVSFPNKRLVVTDDGALHLMHSDGIIYHTICK